MKRRIRIACLAAAALLALPLGGCKSNPKPAKDGLDWDTVSYSAASGTLSAQESAPVPEPGSSAAQSHAPSSSGGQAFSHAEARTVQVTFIEGESLTQMAKKLEQAGVCKASALIDTANSADFSGYSFVPARNSHRCFALEGYLYPDTYEFYKDESPISVLGRMLSNAQSKITAADQNRAQALGYTMDEILTIASILEKEVGSERERSRVSGVLHNRLKDGMQLQCDASIHYIEWYVKPYLTGDINRYNDYYNTYKCRALPAGPICNPGRSAINAALNPADTDALYFASDANGEYYYAATYEEHLANCAQAGIEIG